MEGSPVSSGGKRTPAAGSWLTTPVFLVLAAITVLRLAFIWVVPGRSGEETWLGWVISPDSRDYVYMADDLSDGRQDSISFRTPLYPLLVSLTQYLLARRWLATILIQQLAVALTAIACGVAAGRFCGKRAGAGAAIAYLICPLAFIESVVLLPDVLVAAAISWAGVVWLSTYRAGSASIRLFGAILSGILLGTATLIKPSASLLLLVPPAQLVLSRGAPGKQRLLMGAVVALSALALPTAWRINNYLRFGSPVLTTQDSFELAGRFLVLSGRETQESFWLHYADSIELTVAQGPIVYQNQGCTEVPEGWAGLGGGRFSPSVDIAARDSVFRSAALSSFREAPARIILAHFTRWPWFLANPVGDLGRAGGPPLIRSAIRAGSMAFQLILVSGALLALIRKKVRTCASALLELSALTFVVTGIVTGPLAGTRYSLPFYWALVSVASCGWLSIFPPGPRAKREDGR
jgi:4-amino-4-deoxy-L-arabinose transferase-like glycosyltransferase